MSNWPTFYDHDEIVRLYVEDGLSLRMIRDRLGCSIQTALNVLTARNIARRPKHIQRKAHSYSGARA